MAKTRMSWDWVGDYPVFIYTQFLDHFKFNVRIVIGEKGNQNAKGYGPTAKPDIEYVQTGLISKNEVVGVAFECARLHLEVPEDFVPPTMAACAVKEGEEDPPW